MDFRKIFDSNVPVEQFDKWRTRYCDELFDDLITYAHIDQSKQVLEIGPGTGQAAPPLLDTGCVYEAIELGENFTQAMRDKFDSYPNFDIVHGDFETYDFGSRRYDMIYSAATIQWIPEEIGFPRVYELLRPQGTFAMMLTKTDYKSPNETLYNEIQSVYEQYFHPEVPYGCSLAYSNVENHGFVDLQCHHYAKTRVYTADDFISWTIIQAPHLTLQESDRENFIQGIRKAILRHGNTITLLDDNILYLAKKPQRCCLL